MRGLVPLVLSVLFLLSAGEVTAQRATVEVTVQRIKTYPFSDPDPVPFLASGDERFRFYPYYAFNGYTDRATEKEWKVIRLENPYIKVTVLPQVGGKVWGAVEKSTGDEFIYKNEVLKFRSLGARGPWTSGGIEHNFGLDMVGHMPATSTPVDYSIQSNENGSASVTVGGLDLPSRTKWRVTITVPEDRAYFETNSIWYNPTPLHSSYLSWENAAIQARDDLQFFFPGTHYIGHGGEAYSWPIDEQGRNLSYYRNSDFGGHHSYHVMGKLTDYYAAYRHDADFGMGHWGLYSDTPGKKIWVWSLSRSGAIWEDLLTDTDGQYVEVQSGVKFNQASSLSGYHSPFNQLMLSPYRTDVKEEIWFPIKGIGGVVDASPYGAMNVTRDGDGLTIAINALQALHDILEVTVEGRLVHRELIDLRPMEVHRTQVSLPSAERAVRVAVGRHKLAYGSDPDAKNLERPVVSPEVLDEHSVSRLFRIAEEQMSMRAYGKALETYSEVLDQEPTHNGALTRVAEIYYRQGRYRMGLDHAVRVLEHNAYDPGGNFIYGVIQKRLGDLVNAKDGLSWASRSLKYRTGAYVELAFISLQERKFELALEYAKRALNYNSKNLEAYVALAIAHRQLGQEEKAREALRRLLKIDPLSHFARFERYLLAPTPETLKAFQSMIRNELPHETYLELAMTYLHADLTEEAVSVLKKAPPYPVVYYWLAYLSRNASPREARSYLAKALEASPGFVFPFRLETIPVLKWAKRQNDAWKTKYYLGLLYWSKRRRPEAKELFARCGKAPSFAPFYLTRGYLFREENPGRAVRNFKRAIQEAETEWRTWHALITLYNEESRYEKALSHAEEAYDRFPDNYVTGMDYAISLLNNRQYAEALSVLEGVHVLPYEGARLGHRVYEKANVLYALARRDAGDHEEVIRLLKQAKKWPEHLGQGKPYDPDTRLMDYLMAQSYRRLGQSKQATALLEDVVAYTEEHREERGAGYYVAVLALEALGKTEKARQLLNAWREAAGSNDKQVQWATARFNGDDHRAQQLGRALTSDGGGEVLRWESEWAVLYQAL